MGVFVLGRPARDKRKEDKNSSLRPLHHTAQGEAKDDRIGSLSSNLQSLIDDIPLGYFMPNFLG